jgi:molecular chaperone HtpG
MTTIVEKQTLGFKTESAQLLDLMIDKIYKNKEIFLRELISNAHDAIEKLRFKALSNPQIYEEDAEPKITLVIDKDNQTITLSDNGIGMTFDDVISNLGTIAKSGTKEFLDSLTGDANQDTQLIGQFGVGFYAAFMVADKVIVKTRAAGEPSKNGVRWEYSRNSKPKGEYTIENITRSERGTEIILHLKKEETEFLEDWRLRSIITKYSDHITLPISMKKNVNLDKTSPEAKETSDENNNVEIETEATWETVNNATTLWTLSKDQINDDEYKKFYKHLTHDQNNPFTWIHNKIEGKQEYTTLIYLPLQAGPFDFWNHEKPRGLKLYVKRVFIMDDAEQFLPRYLRFIKGIIDSNDLPLNISREVLQSNRQIDNIRSAITKRILETLIYLSKEQTEKYLQFWKEFGNILKEGLAEDFVNRDSLVKLLRFSSTYLNNNAQTVSFEDYVSRMKPQQDKIYYITAENFSAANNSPNLEIFRDKGIEVLLLHDRIDEWLIAHLTEFDGKNLQSVAKDSDISGIAEEKSKELLKQNEDEFGPLLKQIHEILKDKVKEVRISLRLTSSPACIVNEQNALSSQMQRILQATGQSVPTSRPILELNTQHRLIQNLKEEQDDSRLAEWSFLFLEQSILAEGGQLEDPAGFVKRLTNLLLSK